MNNCSRLIFILIMLLSSMSDAFARQYKSRVFQDSNQELSSAEMQNIAELEQAFAGFQDNYQIATTGQFLARQMVAEQQYEKAVEYYYKSLRSGTESATLAEPVLEQLRLELASVLLKLQRYEEVLTLYSDHATNIEQVLLVARAQLGLQQFHLVTKNLQPYTENLRNLPAQQLQQMAGLLYKAEALQLTTKVLQEILRRSPDDISIARQLTGLYIRLKQFQEALDLWSLKHAQGLLKASGDSQSMETASQDLLLLADLYQRQQAPEKAARLLQQAMSDAAVSPTWQNHYRLFEFWYQAKEIDSARMALWQSIQGSAGTDKHLQHSLILAELLQQAQDWLALQELILFSCETVLPDEYVGRINLFYGIALHKLGNNSDARRAFINASLISGVKPKAREWLAFIGAATATIEESRELWGPCLPEDPEIELPKDLKETSPEDLVSDQQGESSKALKSPSQPEAINKAVEILPVTELKSISLYSTRLTTTSSELQKDLKTKTFTLLKNLMRSGGKVSGKMHLLFSFDDMSEAGANNQLKMSVAFPYSGLPRTKAGFKIIKLPGRKALVRHYKGPATELAAQWQQLVMQAIQQGLTPNGQAVMVFLSDTSGTEELDVELQLLL